MPKMVRLIILLVLTLSQLQFPFTTPRSVEVDILLKFKAALKNSNVLDSWVPTVSSPCNFTGIFCNELRFVTHIELPSRNLVGNLPLDYICRLQYLTGLNFKKNGLTGHVSEDLDKCRNLQYLKLAANGFYGGFPWDSVRNLVNLSFLSIGDNKWEKGPFPMQVLNLRKLYNLYLGNCSIQGQIPSRIGELIELEDLELSANNLTGSIPAEIGKLTKLKQLELYQNGLTGTLPLGFGNLTKLQFLDVSNNSLEGNLTELRFLDNMISLQVYFNRFSGEIPEEFGSFKHLKRFLLLSNKISGALPQKLGSLSDFEFLEASDNELTGSIPPDMCKKGKLNILSMAHNKLTGGIPENYVSCTSLNLIQLSENSLSGSVPTRLWGLPSLKLMDFSSNYFEGEIGSSISEAVSLKELYIERNRFSGEIPVEILNVSSLTFIYFTFNKFSGQIPRNIGELKNLTVIDLQGNTLSGTIPDSIGLCSLLTTINLAENLLTGEIPSSISSLKRLHTLDLSSNKLSGPLPNLSISELNLSNNRFLSNSHNARRDPILAIIVISVVGLSLLYVVVMARREREPEPVIQGSPDLLFMATDTCMYRYEDIMRETEDLSERYRIGHGATSIVYRCELTPNIIAVKRFCSGGDLENSYVDAEIQTIGHIRHKNIIILQGYCVSPKGILLFFEYMHNGSLYDRLHGDLNRLPLDWNTRLKIAIGVADALAYLHHEYIHIVHRDVKSSNILLDENYEARLSDFGLARYIPSSATYVLTHVAEGSIGYMDPEYARTFHFSKKSDVYSFGIVLLELLTGRKALDINMQLISSKVHENTEMECVDRTVIHTCTNMDLVKKAFILAMSCSQENLIERPTMMEVVAELHDCEVWDEFYMQLILCHKPGVDAMLTMGKIEWLEDEKLWRLIDSDGKTLGHFDGVVAPDKTSFPQGP